ncbi:hypothetical protein Ait01nite_008720 [Actinoplanes italicus]|uniref:Uncharacterized protein n=1 Tax=Actinoplanes italicus TaxID=113567 RepID=A0A2T0KLT5_9ACTN|nr:hypothetical protein [Actinoplanes italicus]PRX24447.1 hypothetical protein CLV67_102223 [Actinoplanes italicus]GIE27827.1 hypothetical protein Ait01nite_008720 [Actinoplanes italicus]
MTGNVPQPGETPSDQGNPWTLSDAEDAWWHAEAGPDEADAGPPVAAAHAAGVRDLTRHLAEPPPAEPPGGSRLATAGELMIIEPERVARPGVTPLPEVLGEPEVEARLERMENSPFWLTEEQRAAAEAAGHDRPPGRRRRPPAHNPLTALFCLVVLSLVAAFFGWVSAEPFWLAVGHGDRGYATTTLCQGDGLTQRCTGRFATADGGSTVSQVTLLGIDGDRRHPGAVSPARMVSPDSGQVYTAPAGPLMHLRWGLGFLLVLICGYGIAEATGARRLPTRPTRRSATIASFLGPLLLLGGFLVSAY